MLVGHLNDDGNFYTSYNTAKSDVPAYFHNAFSNPVSFQPVQKFSNDVSKVS